MGVLKTLVKSLFELVVATGAIIVILGSLPTITVFPGFPIEPVSYQTPNFTQDLDRWTSILSDHGQRMLNNEIGGPESLAIRDNFLYTGLADGRLVQVDLDTGKFKTVTRLAPNEAVACENDVYFRLEKCGRPLGLRFTQRGYLDVIDAFFGLYRLNATTGHKKPLGLQPGDKNLPSEWRGLFNDFVHDPENPDIAYVSVSSTKWGLHRTPWSLNEHENTGLVLGLDLRTGRVTHLLGGLYFANGIEISADDKWLLISECTNYRISKLNLAECRKAVLSGLPRANIKKELFAEITIGEPDNIRVHGDYLLVGIAITRALGPTMSDRVAEVPLVRKALARLIYLTSVALDFVYQNLWNHVALEEVVFKLRSGHIFYHSLPPTGAVLVLDARTGQIKAVLGSEKFNAVSEAIIDERTGDLYFGSFKNRFLGLLPAKQLQLALGKSS